MSIRDAVRTTVIGTNAIWPFSSLNKVPYHVAIKTFIGVCKDYPEIKSVYLRSGLAEGNWVPGLSDIDLTVITESSLTVEQEFAFLQTFWKRFARLKHVFPMYGEIEILSDHTIQSWTQFGLPGYGARNWKLVYGVPTVSCNYRRDTRQFSIDCLNHALHFMHWYSGSYFENKFVDRVESPYLLARDLKRLASKIIRCLAHLDGSEVPDVAQDDLFCCVVSRLESAVSHFAAAENSSGGEALEAIIEDTNNRVYVVLRNGLDLAMLKKCVENAKRTLDHKGSILVLSANVFEYLFRYYQPFEYVHLKRRRDVRIPPPDEEALIDSLLHQVPNVLTFPQSEKFGVSLEESKLTVERSLFLKLYWEHGIILPDPKALIAECERRYPEWFAVLQTQRPFELFKLLRALTNEVHKYL